MPNPNRSTAFQRAIIVLLAVAAALVVWSVETHVLGIDLLARPAPGIAPAVVGLPAVASATLVAGLMAWALVAILERATPAARSVWIAVAVVTLLVSLAAPLTGGMTTQAAIGLACLHLTAATVLTPLLARSIGRQASRSA